MSKLPHNCTHLTASKVMLKILQVSLHQYVNWELPDVQAGFRKGRGTRDQIANIHWVMKKQESSRKTSTSASLTMLKPLTVWITINCGKILQELGIDHLTSLLRNLHAGQEATTVRTRHGKTDWFQTGKGVHQGCLLSSWLLTYMQTTSCKVPDWMKQKLESRSPGAISITSDMQMTPPLWQKWRGTKEPVDESERGEWKRWLKIQY